MITKILVAGQVALLSLILGSATLASAEVGKYERKVESYTIPDVQLVNQEGQKTPLKELLSGETPVVVEFIFGTCTTICPVLSAGYSNLQRRVGADTQKIKLVSISIDPENDTPKVMGEYLQRYGAKPGWDFLTGSRQDIDLTMRAFAAYVPNKMSHYPLTLIRLPGEGQWLRINGLLSTSEFMAECQKAGII